jgi:indolepyruvate ferredoxin oxidoreductase
MPLDNNTTIGTTAIAGGRAFLTGAEALVALIRAQRGADVAAGLNTAGFVTGYRGSPLAGFDQELWRCRAALRAEAVHFLPAVNEDLAATTVLGSQRVESDPLRRVDGVFALWYGKGPGVDRSADALKHGNAYGSSPTGGVLLVVGDDHGCVSSSMPHQSEQTLMACGIPVLHPASVAEYIEFGLFGWALSRFSGLWVALKAISETAESARSIDLASPSRFAVPPGFVAPASGLHYRWPDMPGPQIEYRLIEKHAAAQTFAEANSIDRISAAAPSADLGIIAPGKAYLDLREALRWLGVDEAATAAQGIRVYKPGLIAPLAADRLAAFAEGLRAILVVEEKEPVVERQVKELLYNRPAARRPAVIGKADTAGAAFIPSAGELRPSILAPLLLRWLRSEGRDVVLPEWIFAAAPQPGQPGGVPRRSPYFCSGCPHNLSTRVPSGSRAQSGTGCHFMASWMDRETTGLTQMGGDGADWVAHSLFTRTPHVFQNLGDGTYHHSGILAIRQAVAADTTITFKILFNNAVAMTGGRPVDGMLAVPQICRQLLDEGARMVVVVADDPGKYRGRHRLPRAVAVHGRRALDGVQRRLRLTPGVTVLIYDQGCAAEKRRRRGRGAAAPPPVRAFINTAVCEGCGDCGDASNCVSVLPVDTAFGRKRAIDQWSCNADLSCMDGFCPSFVSVIGGRLRAKPLTRAPQDPVETPRDPPEPAIMRPVAPYSLLIAGMGGTGIVTLGSIVAGAAHHDGLESSVLHFTGFAQKGGAVLSHVRLAPEPSALNQVRIDRAQADALLACDMLVAASAEACGTIRPGHTKIVVNRYLTPLAETVRDPDLSVAPSSLLERLGRAAGTDAIPAIDARDLAQRLMGDPATANVLMLGLAWQQGLVPVTRASIERAIRENGVAVQANLAAFEFGRLAVPDRLVPTQGDTVPTLDAMIASNSAFLTDYQDARYARQYRDFVAEIAGGAAARLAPTARLLFTEAVARNFFILMAYKDEYEVARLLTRPDFAGEIDSVFEPSYALRFHLAPPLLGLKDAAGRPRKIAFGPWLIPAMRLLARARRLRGTWLDPFGHTQERSAERALIAQYRETVTCLARDVDENSLDLALEIARLPASIRGFGHVKRAAMQRAQQRRLALMDAFAVAAQRRVPASSSAAEPARMRDRQRSGP